MASAVQTASLPISPPRLLAVSPAQISIFDPGDMPAGFGSIRFEKINGRTIPLRAHSAAPLKFLMPRSSCDCGWVVTSTYGGGLVEGDNIDLQVIAGTDTRCLITTQASTKVYRTPGGASRQTLNLVAHDHAIAIIAPDPLVCFAGASFHQRQRFNLAGSAGLVLVDWFTSGRWARGERWAFSRYESGIEVSVDGKPAFRDALLLDPVDGPIGGAMRMGNIDCFATLLLVGPPLKEAANELSMWINSQPAPLPGAAMIFAASPVAEGIVIRVAGSSAQSVGQWIHERLNFLQPLIGMDPWSRKF